MEGRAAVFAVLADPTRLRLIGLLCRQRLSDALCVKALADALGISQPAVSQHLRVLKSIGLVKGERRGYRIHYFINREALERFRELVRSALSAEETDTSSPCPQDCPQTKRG